MKAWLEAFAARNKLSPEAKEELLRRWQYEQEGAIPTAAWIGRTMYDSHTEPVSLETLEPVRATAEHVSMGKTHWSGTNQKSTPPLSDSRMDVAPTELMPGFTTSPPTQNDTFLRRYEDLGQIGLGGMGEVRRVRDIALNRVVAVKIIRDDMREHPAALVRFVEEAQITAQLKHPGIVPVHELGHLPDDRIYFTMKEVKGQTFSKVIHRVHQASRKAEVWAESDGWTLRRLVETFLKVCEAIAYAHSRNVLHRDIKADNVMVGDYGEALVVDWGVAKVLGRPDRVAADSDLQVTTDRSQHRIHETQSGNLVGTLAYMPPEQAMGEVETLTAAADVFALGAMLYEILAGRPPFTGGSPATLLHKAQQGKPYFPPLPDSQEPVSMGKTVLEVRAVTEVEVESWHSLWIPPELLRVCQKAMAFEPKERYAHAGELAKEITAWLDGSQKREHASQWVEKAKRLYPEIQNFRERAKNKQEQAEALLETIAPHEPETIKMPAWELEQEAKQLLHEAALRQAQYIQLLQGALTYAPGWEEAHQRLAQHYKTRHQEAESQRDHNTAAQFAVFLRQHDVGRHFADYLKGDGSFTLLTQPVAATVDLYEYAEVNRRLEPRFVLCVGKTPKRKLSLPMGSYVLHLRSEGHETVRYPIVIHRQEHWDGQAPGENEARPIWLPPKGSLSDNEVYVPAGWFWAGGDPLVEKGFERQKIWVEGFTIQRFSTTNAEYLNFLNDLVQQGREEEALRYVPRERSSSEDVPGAIIYKRDDKGHFDLGPDADGDIWDPEWPVVMIDWWSAKAYTSWLSEATGQPWRLPTELEWEKAARGVDGRFFPWGDHFDASWCCMRDSHIPGRLTPSVVDSYPVDVSPYGVRGMAGNSRDWCADEYVQDGHIHGAMALPAPSHTEEDPNHYRNFRGGSWLGQVSRVRLANRNNALAYNRASHLGLRPCRSLPDGDEE
ncbi:MAG: protein kinase [Deltaproteobacteria bacterium]|nr:MAG: protein kinase [Deltaproteobacteria bacterium]